MPAAAAISIRGRWAPAPDFKSTDKAKSDDRGVVGVGQRTAGVVAAPSAGRSLGQRVQFAALAAQAANPDSPGRPRRRWPTPGR